MPVLLIAASRPALLRRAWIYALGCAATYLPFLLWGRVETFHFTWPIWSSATIGLFFAGHAFTWQLRAVQGGLVCLTGTVMALRREAPIWATPTILIAVRLLFDPEQYGYYWVALVVCLVVCLIVAAWAGVDRRWTGTAVLSTVGAFVALALPSVIGARTDLVLHTLALVALFTVIVRLIRRPAVAPGRLLSRGTP